MTNHYQVCIRDLSQRPEAEHKKISPSDHQNEIRILNHHYFRDCPEDKWDDVAVVFNYDDIMDAVNIHENLGRKHAITQSRTKEEIRASMSKIAVERVETAKRIAINKRRTAGEGSVMQNEGKEKKRRVGD